MSNVIFALIGALLWTGFFCLIIYLRQTPTAQVRRRISTMVHFAEAEREKIAKQNKDKAEKEAEKENGTPSFNQRVIAPIYNDLEEFLRKFTPTYIVTMIEDRIFRAGKSGKWSVKKLAAAWALSVALGLFLGFRYATVNGDEYLITQQILITIIGGVGGGFVPFLLLNNTIKKRQKLLKHQLPEFLDLLCVSVQAGLSFDSAVAKITLRMKGALADEFKHMQEDIKFGMTKQYALMQLGKRCDIEEIYLFCTSIIQAEKLGTSMAQTLTLQSDNMRERHRQFVKAEALKAPVKMLFPMVLFIFPSIFVVLLMPSVISITKAFAH